MLKFQITLTDHEGVSLIETVERVGLLDAIYFGECRVVEALQTPNIAPETPIWLQVILCDSVEAPAFYLARYGTSEDLPPFFAPCRPAHYCPEVIK